MRKGCARFLAVCKGPLRCMPVGAHNKVNMLKGEAASLKHFAFYNAIKLFLNYYRLVSAICSVNLSAILGDYVGANLDVVSFARICNLVAS